jgi:fatty-acid desaturase
MRYIDLIDKRYVLTAMQLLGPPIAVYAIYMYGSLPWLSVSFIIFMLMNVLGGTIAYHRIHCHSTHKMNPIVESICTFLGLHATYSSPIDYAAIHVAHHKYSDTEKDPHSFKHMGLKTFFPILWDTGGPTGGDLRTVVRLMRNKITLFFHRNYFFLIAAPYLLLFISAEVFFFIYFIPTVAATLSTAYSTFNHDKYGPYDRGLLYSLATGGEHKHVWHHNNPGDTSGEGWLDIVINMVAKKRDKL